MLVEVIVTDVEEAVFATTCGADRLELITNFAVGGLTPDLAMIKQVCMATHIPVNVMLRSHANSFIYSSLDKAKMLQDLQWIRDNTRANGIVVGGLNPDYTIDFEFLKQVVKHKGHLKCTFHKAIDETKNIIEAYSELLDSGLVDDVLTSGGKPNVLEGIPTILQLQNLFEARNAGNNSGISAMAKILPGGGITLSNLPYIINSFHLTQIHVGTAVRTDGSLDKTKFDGLINIIADQN